MVGTPHIHVSLVLFITLVTLSALNLGTKIDEKPLAKGACIVTVDKLESQIRRNKTKFLKKRKDYPQIVSYIEDDGGADYDLDSDVESKITRRKEFTLRPMTSEDAVLQLEMLGHDFFVYLDAELDSVCVLYKRKEGGYGLLEPKY